jgi:hypothetical protein
MKTFNQFIKEGKGYQPEIEHSKMGDAKKKADKKRESSLPPHLQGDAIGKMKKAFATEGKDGLWDNIRQKKARMKSGSGEKKAKPGDKDYPKTLNVEGAAWTKKSGQNKEGGLNEKGRKSYEAENPGSDLKAPSKKPGNKRRASFCARMKGMRKRQKPSNNTGDDRLSKSLRAWNC